MPPPLFVILMKLLNMFNCIYFSSTFFSRGTFLAAKGYHVPHTISNGLWKGTQLRHVTIILEVAHHSFLTRRSPCFLEYSRSIWTQRYIFGRPLFRGHQTVTVIVSVITVSVSSLALSWQRPLSYRNHFYMITASVMKGLILLIKWHYHYLIKSFLTLQVIAFLTKEWSLGYRDPLWINKNMKKYD